MMVNMNGLSYGTWRNIQKAIEQFDSPVKSSGNYLLKLQEVFTPGHTRQIHVLPKLGDAAEYQRVSDKYCWEIIVADDTRFGRHVSVCSYFTEPAFEVFADTLGWNEQHREQYRGRVKNALIIAFVMCVGAMLLGCILALLMIGVFLLL